MTKLSNERVEELDELDRVARTAARQSGHSHVIAQLPALSSNGRVVGRLTGDKCHSCVFRHVDSFLVTSALTSLEKKADVDTLVGGSEGTRRSEVAGEVLGSVGRRGWTKWRSSAYSVGNFLEMDKFRHPAGEK